MNYLAEGTRYILPQEARLKRLVETALASVLSESGYDEVVIPVVQTYDPDSPKPLRRLMDTAYKFIDYRGRVMILRPDMTEIVASLAVNELKNACRPLRLFYCGSVIRAPRPGAAARIESYQMGAEIIGTTGAEADAELVGLAVTCLKEAGITQSQVSLGHVGIIEGIMELAGMQERAKSEARDALLCRDFVRLERLVESLDISPVYKDFFIHMLGIPDGESLLDKAERLFSSNQNPAIIKAVSELRRTLAAIEAHGIAPAVRIDLGLVRDLEYYTGIVFEAYVPGHGKAILGGGRYDGLLQMLGRQEGAAGFALDIGQVLEMRCT